MEPGALCADSSTRHRQRYLANLAALYVADPELAGQIDSLPFTRTPALEIARDGNATVHLTADNGQTVYAHSRYHPLDEARSLVHAQVRGKKAEGKGNEATRHEGTEAQRHGDAELDHPAFLVAGLGLGYHVAELERSFHRPLLIVVEDELPLIKAAFCVDDFSVPLRERRLTFLTSADKATVHQKLRSAITHLMLGMSFVTLPHTARFHAAFYAQIRALMRDFVSYSRVQVFSLVRHARGTCRNVAFNLASYAGQPGVEVLKGRGAGYPAILVAAGPSLARNVDQLGGLCGRAVVIAVQTVFKTLLARGVPPHFVTSLDYHEVSAQFFHGIADFGRTILVAEPKANWHVLDAYRGRTHLLRSEFADDLLRDAAPVRAALPAGSTVAHLSFYLAEYLGCDPIILVGQDLSFSDGLYYPPGMQVERNWQPEMGRFQTVEMKQWERIIRTRSSLHVVQDIHGRPTYTDDQLFTYAEQFQSNFLASRSHVVHACEGGMRLEGTEVMTLREAGERFCTRALPADLFALDPVQQPPDLKERVCTALDQRIEELRQTRQIAAETSELLAKLSGLVERPDEFNRLVARIDELRSLVRQNDRTYNLVVQVSQMAELRRLQADRSIHDDETETPATARRRLERDRAYVGAFIEGCDYLLQMLPEALQRVRERL